ncbi:hypothetical protein SHIRM173S_01594 [Streptomyces hirsutus]
MKADGVEYEERMERLQEVTYPKPLSELLWHAVRRVPHEPPVGERPSGVAEVRSGRNRLRWDRS